MTPETIKNIVLNDKNFKKTLKPIELEILSFVPFAKTFDEALHCISNGIISPPICQYLDCMNIIPHRTHYGVTGYYAIGCCYGHTSKLNNLVKYGFENVSQLKEVKEKKKTTTFKHYGVENPKQNKDVAEKIAKTMSERYGGFGKGSPTLKNKIERTLLEKHGVTNPMHVEEHRDKLVSTLFDKSILRLEPFVKPNFSPDNYLGSDIEHEWICQKCGELFLGITNCKTRIPRCYSCYPISSSKSKAEIDLFESIEFNEKISSDKEILNGYELDIFIPSKKLAIEFNGLYWHSESNGKDVNYHLNKTIQCENKGIQLIHVFEDEWFEKREVVLSIIHRKLGIVKNEFLAENCEIRELKPNIKDEFLKTNSLVDFDDCAFSIGLFTMSEELVEIITFKKINNTEWKMCNHCLKNDFSIKGGFFKLMNHFLKNISPTTINIELDRRLEDGTEYLEFGFLLIDTIPPSNYLLKFNYEIHDIVWDCGKKKFKMERSK